MSEDMSMFKKMKDKITDEVNSATNKLQNIQIIDQLATSIGQQLIKNDSMPHLRLPEIENKTDMPTNSRFSLVEDDPLDGYVGDEELNSEISPQHELYDVLSIGKLKSDTSHAANDISVQESSKSTKQHQLSVIDLDHPSSDLEDEVSRMLSNDDTEIDLLSNEDRTTHQLSPHTNDPRPCNHLKAYKTKYRDVVHALRKLKDDSRLEKYQMESETKKMKDLNARLQKELEASKKQLKTEQINNSDCDKKSESVTFPTHNKQINKIRDLEQLMAKCKASLKAKNAQLKILKDSVNEVDNFKDNIKDLRRELKELKNAHETWTLSIAENKRVMHQEIENKNSETTNIQVQLKESNNRCLQLKSTVQSLESRFVNISAAHLKERESLIKEITAVKNNAIKHLQRDHELQLERVKLDLEKSIESLKGEILTKDEQILRGAQREQELQKQNSSLVAEIESAKKKCDEYLVSFDDLESQRDEAVKKNEVFKAELDSLKKQNFDLNILENRNEMLDRRIRELDQQVINLTDEVTALERTNKDLNESLEDLRIKQNKINSCSTCLELQKQLVDIKENHEQKLFELNAKCELLTTANNDQEKALDELKTEHNSNFETIKCLRVECEEHIKKNESLVQIIHDNELEIQAQQAQVSELKHEKQQYDVLKKANSTLTCNFNQVKSELSERNSDIIFYQKEVDKIKNSLTQAEQALKNASIELGNLKQERESLVQTREIEHQRRREIDQNLVLNILTALKNLETPETSPGSDKTYQSDLQESEEVEKEHRLPDPVKLAESLSSLALGKSNAYITSNQRLQAVLLDNTMLKEEMDRLKEELNALNEERTKEVMHSLDEVDRLKTENQALIHDQKAYDDQIAMLEAEIKSLKEIKTKLETERINTLDEATKTFNDDETLASEDALAIRDREIEDLKKLIAVKKEEMENLQTIVQVGVPSSTEFEYLKNIVFQFLIGREPVTLARVISAIFRFDKEQIDNICKFQETIHQVSSG